MLNELSGVLTTIRKEQKHDELIVLGDFNMPIIKWTYGDDDSGLLAPTLINAGRQESELIEVCAAFNLIQKNSIPNSEGRFLDLTFTAYF